MDEHTPDAYMNQQIGVAIITAAQLLNNPPSDTRELSLLALYGELTLLLPPGRLTPSAFYLMALTVRDSGVDVSGLGSDVGLITSSVEFVLGSLPEFKAEDQTRSMLDVLASIAAVNASNTREISAADVFGVTEPLESP